MDSIQILVIDLGSQYTLVIGRTLRELGFRSIILSPKRADKWLEYNQPKGIILSGGSASIYEEDAPSPPKKILSSQIPILGICYGMHWLVQKSGGIVEDNRQNKEYGEAKAFFREGDNRKNILFSGLRKESIVWASHGDSVSKLPPDFEQISRSEEDVIAAIAHRHKKIWGIQFHPEVTHTKEGKTILGNFMRICKCSRDWNPKDIIADIRKEVADLAKDKKAIIGFSGGVDSSTLSAIISPVFKSNLLAVCIDTGGLRKDEIKEIEANAQAADIRLKIVREFPLFSKALGNATHSETKRKRFKKAYGQILEREAKSFKADFVIQGTLATDIIESGHTGKAALIKSHHNVGLNLNIKELHPFRNLFKYEVRSLAEELQLPRSISQRHPFPGPGLFIRIIGKPPKSDKLSILKWADVEVTQILKKHNVYDEASQWIIGLECNKTVGIKGEARVYAFTIIVRGLITADFMTGRGYQIPDYVRREITTSITKHPKIVRVHYDEANKPPATAELE